MSQFLHVPQPPVANQYSFLVDEMSPHGTLGDAYDPDKVAYNLALLGNDFKIDVEVQSMLSKKGATVVVPIGRYIAVIGKSKDGAESRMTFFDFTVPMDRVGMYHQLKTWYGENITTQWFTVFHSLQLDFRESDDNAILFKPS